MKKFAYTLVAQSGAPPRPRPSAVYVTGPDAAETLVIDDAGPRYYRNVRMATNPDAPFPWSVPRSANWCACMRSAC